MKLWWIAALSVLVGCGGEVLTASGPVDAILTGSETPGFGVSVRGWNIDPDGDDEECLDNGGTSWCSADTSAVKKSVRFTAAGSTQFDTFYLYIRNNQSAEGTIHLKVAVRDVVQIDREVTLSPGEKRLVGVFNDRGHIEWKNGF